MSELLVYGGVSVTVIGFSLLIKGDRAIHWASGWCLIVTGAFVLGVGVR